MTDRLTDRASDSLAELYHCNTKLGPWSSRSYGHSILSFEHSGLAQLVANSQKLYPHSPSVELPPPVAMPCDSLAHTLFERRTPASFRDPVVAIPLPTLSSILYYSASVYCPDRLSSSPSNRAFRPYPSGGGLYPLELYLVSLAIDGLPSGLFHYQPYPHGLRQIRLGDCRADLQELLLSAATTSAAASLSILPDSKRHSASDRVNTAAAVMFITALFSRSMVKYGDRGYRLILLEAGHLAQNLLLVATAFGHAMAPLGGFLDDQLALFLGDLRHNEEEVIYPLLLGTV